MKMAKSEKCVLYNVAVLKIKLNNKTENKNDTNNKYEVETDSEMSISRSERRSENQIPETELGASGDPVYESRWF